MSVDSTKSKFWYPAQLHSQTSITDLVVPWFDAVPTNRKDFLFVLTQDVGKMTAGMYLFNGFGIAQQVFDYKTLNNAFLTDGSIKIYINVAEANPDEGAKIYRNGVLTDVTSIPQESNAVWSTLKPTNSASNTVTSVNGKSGAVTLTAADVGAVTSSDLATVATTGAYSDLSGTPTIPAAQVNSDWNASSGVAQILNKPTIPAAQINADWNAGSGVSQILNKPTLGTAAAANTGDFATSAQGTLAATAVQPGDLASVATSGEYSDLSGTPTIPAAQVNSDWNSTSGITQILNKPTLGSAAGSDVTDFATSAQGTLAGTAVQPGDLSAVATSGSYNDLSDTPTLGTAASADTSAFATSAQGDLANSAIQPGDLATVATSGSYSDLTNTPTIPAAQVNSDWDATSGVAQILNKPSIPAAYVLPDATESVKGGVIIGSGLSVVSGTASVTNPVTPQPDSALPDLTAAPDETWVNDVLKPLLVAAGILQSP